MYQYVWAISVVGASQVHVHVSGGQKKATDVNLGFLAGLE